MQVKQETEVGQILWMLLNNKKSKKKKAGVIYAPQEDVTPNKELKNCIHHNGRNHKSKRPKINNNRRF